MKSSRNVSCLCLWVLNCLPASNSVSKSLLSSSSSLLFSLSLFIISECVGPDHGATPVKGKSERLYFTLFIKQSRFFSILATRCQCTRKAFHTMNLGVSWTGMINGWYWWVDMCNLRPLEILGNNKQVLVYDKQYGGLLYFILFISI